RRCLDSLYRAFAEANLPPHVVVVDNASTDGSVAMVRQEFPKLLVIENSTNVGFGAGCNQGLAAAGDAVLFLNPDTELAPYALCVRWADSIISFSGTSRRSTAPAGWPPAAGSPGTSLPLSSSTTTARAPTRISPPATATTSPANTPTPRATSVAAPPA